MSNPLRAFLTLMLSSFVLPAVAQSPPANTVRTPLAAGRLTSVVEMPANPPHYRSGAALYYVLSGTGAFTADGKTEPRPAGTSHFEHSGWVHQWENPGDGPLVLLQANISQEGIPAILPAQR